MPDEITNQDELIIRMLAADHEHAIKLLFDQYYVLLSDVTFHFLKDREISDDIIQELFISIWVKRHTIKLRPPLSHYLVRAVMNRAKNYRRDRSRSKEILTDNFKEFENTILGIPADSSLEVQDIKKLWKQAMARMSPRASVIFMMSRKKSMTYKEIALHLGLSVKTVEKNLSLALKVLRDVFRPHLKVLLLLMLLPLD